MEHKYLVFQQDNDSKYSFNFVEFTKHKKKWRGVKKYGVSASMVRF